MSEPQAVGLIGAGLLGSAMAERLLERGLAVVGFDIDPARITHLQSIGGRSVNDPVAVVDQCSTVLVSLPTSSVAGQVLASALPRLDSTKTVVDTTTGDPEQMVALGQRLGQRGATYVEATVAGSSSQFRQGGACFFLGGDAAALDRLRWLWDSLGQHWFLLGPVGSASRFKLVHNLVLGLHRAVLAEGLVFAEAMGFEAAQVLAILQQTPAASAVMATKGPKMAAGDWSPQARLSQHAKDVRLMLAAAVRHKTRLPLTEVHQQLLGTAEALGCGEMDNCAVIQALRAHDRRSESPLPGTRREAAG
jgi:3-hydroxyisobutyrate dehydrogenase-like beta-hydroxyacid dehydrogenase